MGIYIVASLRRSLRPYIDAGYTGFTFNNSVFRTPDEIRQIAASLK